MGLKDRRKSWGIEATVGHPGRKLVMPDTIVAYKNERRRMHLPRRRDY